MKYAFLFTFLSGIFFSLKYCKPVSNKQEADTINTDSGVIHSFIWIFEKDSGYVTNQQILPFLIREKIIDTVGSSNYKDANDTIGKYYAYSENQVLVQVTDLSNTDNFDSEVLMVLKNVNQQIQLVQKERYFHGNYDCCDAGFGSFVKYGNSYGIKICGTGSAFCSGNVYMFNKITPEIYSNYIPVYRYTASEADDKYKDGYYIEYFGDVSENKNDLVVTYHYESGPWSENRVPDKKMKFKVRYTYSEKHGWQAQDSSYFKKYLDLN